MKILSFGTLLTASLAFVLVGCSDNPPPGWIEKCHRQAIDFTQENSWFGGFDLHSRCLWSLRFR